MKTAAQNLFASLLALAFPCGALAADAPPKKPSQPSPGFVNDWLRKNDPAKSIWDVGAQIRLRYEVKDNFGIAGSPGSVDFRAHGADVDNSYLLHRVRPRLGYSGKWFGVFVEGRESGSTDDDRNPNPESDGPMDLHQAYVTLGNAKEFPVSFKLGRQEMIYGDERLIGASGWNNLARVFDSAKLRWQNPHFSADFFTGRVIIPDDNNFNLPNDYDWFSGVYVTAKLFPKQATEFYFLSRNASAQSPDINGAGVPALLRGPSARDIYTAGMRIKSAPGEFGNWDYSGEFMGQFGHFNDPAVAGGTSLEHQAFAVFAGGGYTWTQSSHKPRLGIEYNFATGDTDSADGKHETFENLFPTNHKFYGFMDFASLQNLHDLRLATSAKPMPRLTVSGDFHFLWLADTHDSFYTVAGARRGGVAATGGAGYGINPSYGSYVGSELDLTATYAVCPHAVLEAGYGHFFVGEYVKQSLSAPAFGSQDANWVYLQMNFNF